MTTDIKVPEGLTEEQIDKFCNETVTKQEADGWTFWYEDDSKLIFFKPDPDEHEQHHDEMADEADRWRKARQEDKA